MHVRRLRMYCLVVLALQLVMQCEPGVQRTQAVPQQNGNTVVTTLHGASLAGIDPVQIPLQFQASSADILNPERGFYTTVDLPTTTNLANIRTLRNNTLIRSYVRLDDYRASDLPQAFLDALDRSFDSLRKAGVKTVLRFSYNFGPYPDSEPDASLPQVLRHIAQVKPLLQRNADVIVWMEAGFIGAWGEWHTSTNGLDTIENKRIILNALLDALPRSRTIQVRYPDNIIDLVGAPPTATEAYNGSAKARVGHHNDCFLASESDSGTYKDGIPGRIQAQADLTLRTRYTSMGGETCKYNPPRSDCPTALSEMQLLHFTSINNDFKETVIGSWQNQGCYATMRQRLGYRLTLSSGTVSDRVAPGGVLQLSVQLSNSGFAAPVNARPVYVVLDGPVRYQARVQGVDARQWQPGDAVTLSVRLRLPQEAPAGQYTVALWLPDAATALQLDPKFAIQLANQGTWDAANGWNILTKNMLVDSATTKTSDSQAQDLLSFPPLSSYRIFLPLILR